MSSSDFDNIYTTMNKENSHFADATLEPSSGPIFGAASTTHARVEVIPEAELAKRTTPLHLHPSRVLPSHFTDAIEREYFPASKFWFHVDAERFVAELQNHNSTYMNALALSWEHWGCGSFHEDLVNSICTKKFDEHCAAWLLANDLISQFAVQY